MVGPMNSRFPRCQQYAAELLPGAGAQGASSPVRVRIPISSPISRPPAPSGCRPDHNFTATRLERECYSVEARQCRAVFHCRVCTSPPHRILISEARLMTPHIAPRISSFLPLRSLACHCRHAAPPAHLAFGAAIWCGPGFTKAASHRASANKSSRKGLQASLNCTPGRAIGHVGQFKRVANGALCAISAPCSEPCWLAKLSRRRPRAYCHAPLHPPAPPGCALLPWHARAGTRAGISSRPQPTVRSSSDTYLARNVDMAPRSSQCWRRPGRSRKA